MRSAGAWLLGGVSTLFILAGCSGREPTDPWPLETGPAATDIRSAPPSDVGEPDAPSRFAGLWLITQPFHAVREATLYEFRPDGQLIEHWRSFNSRRVEDRPRALTGWVSRCGGGGRGRSLRCRFTDRWEQISLRQLKIRGQCADGRRRDIVIRLPLAAAHNSLDAEVVSVDGEDGWCHDGFEWRWAHCPDDLSVDAPVSDVYRRCVRSE
ncbi:MAG: hypothetical protein ABEL76_10910 [Bradymonadaceae bacterium]